MLVGPKKKMQEYSHVRIQTLVEENDTVMFAHNCNAEPGKLASSGPD